MIIKINGADFSQNNLGKVVVTTELAPFTKAAIAASGNDSLTLTQKVMLNDLFLKMGVDGSNDVMSKIHRLYLPIIAGDVSHALINYKDSSFVNDMVLDSSHWTLRSNGLVGIAPGQNITLVESNPIMQDNFFELFLRTELVTYGVGDTSYAMVLRGKTNTNAFLGLNQQSVSNDTMCALSSYGAEWGSWDKRTDAIKTSGVNSASTYNDVLKRGVYTHEDTPKTTNVDMSGETSQDLYVLGLNSTNTTKPYGVLMLGEALDSQDFLNIANAVDNLYSSFVNA